jgi:replicative DNA helicase
MASTDDILRRVPPNDSGAEQSILGSILIDNGTLDRALEVINADDFYRDSHRDIFLAMLDLAAGKAAIDERTLSDALRARGRLEAIGGPAYFAELASLDATPAPSNIVHYAKIVHDKALLRGLGNLGQTLITGAYDAPGEWSADYTEEFIAGAE